MEFAHSLVRQRLKEFVSDKGTLLEIGCGIGQTGLDSVGVDIDRKAVECFPGTAVVADALHLPFPNNSFDCVVFSAVLHHLKEHERYLCEAVRVSRHYVVAFEPNLLHPSGMLMNLFNTLKPGITGLDPKERALSPFYLLSIFRRYLTNVHYMSASHAWNRLPVKVNQFISRYDRGLNLFGWFLIIYGEKQI